MTAVCAFADEHQLQGEHVTLYLFDDLNILAEILEFEGDWNHWDATQWKLSPRHTVVFASRALIVVSTKPLTHYVNASGLAEPWSYDIAEMTVHAMFHREWREASQPPEWLNEGMAGLMRRMATAWADDAPYRHDQQLKSDAKQGGPNLEYLHASWAYATGLEAAELLAAHTGIEAFAEFYSTLHGTNDWQPVFEDAFGISADQFYNQYDVHWNRGLPDLHIPLTSEAVNAWQLLPSPEEQRQTLVKFYAATGGDEWMNNQGWLTDLPLDQWHGVTTDHRGNVTELRLPGNNLTGELPDSIIDLFQLESLILNDNLFVGNVAAFVQHLESLDNIQAFNIAGNYLSGCLPETLRDIKETDFLFSGLNYCDDPPFPTPFIKWVVGDFVSVQEERAAKIGVQWLFKYAESVGWPIVGDDITVYFMTHASLAHAFASEGEGGDFDGAYEFFSHRDGRAVPHTNSNFNKAYSYGAYVPETELFGSASLLIHENIHTAFQHDINGLYSGRSLANSLGVNEPFWFTEGMASYYAFHIISGTAFRCHGCQTTVNGVLVPVSEIPLSVAEDQYTCEYKCGALAIELLASIVGHRHIVDFYTMRRPGRTWQETFEEVFGISVPDFYNLYDQHRYAGFPELNPPIVPETPRESEGETTQLPDHPGDRATLLALHNATHGDGWVDDSNWLSDKPLATWRGISIDSNGRVEGIDLSENGLLGNLPPEIGDLIGLKWLILDGNQIHGTIPEKITQLTNLEHLSLADNQLEGSIPAGMDGVNNLQHLALNGNDISGQLPASMMSMSSLQYLNLENNHVGGSIPNNIGGLKSLVRLNLSGNQITGNLPSSIGMLSKLQDLFIAENQLSGEIPASLGNLTSLTYLDLRFNELTGRLPSTLGFLTSLGSLLLDYNRLHGSIPEEFVNMTNLSNLFLNDNQLTGQFPAWLTELENLRSVYLAANSFTGCIPPELFNISIHDLDDIPLPECS